MARTKSDTPSVAEMVESIVGCKWSLHVLASVRRGVNRPGAMVRATRGLTTKVLNERLTKMVRFGILTRVAFPEVPPRVEYRLTPLGERFAGILDQVESVQRDLEDSRRGAEQPAGQPLRQPRSAGVPKAGRHAR